MVRKSRPRAHRSPSAHRSLFVLALLCASPARAQSWTEADVIALAAGSSPEAQAALVEARLAAARAAGEGLFPNPSIDWERQEAFAPNAQAQDLVRVVIPLDLSGRPFARRAVAEVELALADAGAASARGAALEAALVLFYRALAAERRV